MEIERKFTIKTLPAKLAQYEKRHIEQAYLTTNPVVRVRQDKDTYYMTYKGSGMMAREEYNLPLTREAYETLRSKADGNVISKDRYIIPLPSPRFQDGFIPPQPLDLVIELDVFDPPFAPLIMAEVEFPDIETANHYLPEDWFLEDVTNDKQYHNSNMSRRTF